MLSRASAAQEWVDLVENEESAQVRSFRERKRDRFLQFAEPHRHEIGVMLLDELEVEPLGEVPGERRLASTRRTREEEGERERAWLGDAVRQGDEVDVGRALLRKLEFSPCAYASSNSGSGRGGGSPRPKRFVSEDAERLARCEMALDVKCVVNSGVNSQEALG